MPVQRISVMQCGMIFYFLNRFVEGKIDIINYAFHMQVQKRTV